MDVTELHRRTVDFWQRTLEGVRQDQWDDPTPCTEWSVRDLVNHVVGEELWTVPLMEGRTIEEVGDRFDGDVVGDDPVARGREASAEAVAAAEKRLPEGGMIHVSSGQITADEYARQLAADHLIHGWDLAAGSGQARELDPGLVSEVAAWFGPQVEEMMRSSGAIAQHQDATGDPQTDLLAAFGRRADWQP